MAEFIRYEEVSRSGGRAGKRRVKVVKCDCGEEVWCESFTNTCECGADFNASGSKLADRSVWGEETGECASDVLVSDERLLHLLEDGW